MSETNRLRAPVDVVSPLKTVTYPAGYEGPMPAEHRKLAEELGAIDTKAVPKEPSKTDDGK